MNVGAVRAAACGVLEVAFAPFGHARVRAMTAVWLLATVAGVSAYAGRGVRHIPIAVVDADQSAASRRLIRSLMASPALRVVARVDDPGAVWPALRAGELGAVLTIPRGFGRSEGRPEAATLRLTSDGANLVYAKNVYKAVAQVVSAVAGEVAQGKLQRMGLKEAQAHAALASVEVVARRPGNAALTYGAYVAPPLAFYLVHVYIVLLAAGLVQPQLWPDPGAGRRGAARTLGRGVGAAAVGVGLCLLVTLTLYPALELPMRAPFGHWLGWCAAMSGTSVVMVAAILAWLPERALAFDAAVFLAMLSLMASGVTWPVDAFPPALQRLSSALPLTEFVHAAQALALMDVPAGTLDAAWRQCAWVAVCWAAALALGLGARRAWSRRAAP